MAIHNYANSEGGKTRYLPQGTVANPSLAPSERLSFLVPLLPFMEQGTLFRGLDLTRDIDAEANHNAGVNRVKTLECSGQDLSATASGLATTSYVGCAGFGVDAPYVAVTDKNCGAFGYDRRVALGDIKDGLSQTLLLLETRDANGAWIAGGAATLRAVDSERQPYIGENGAFGGMHRPRNEWHFAKVPVLANAAMADGSVRVLPDSISLRTLQALATIAGGDEPGSDY